MFINWFIDNWINIVYWNECGFNDHTVHTLPSTIIQYTLYHDNHGMYLNRRRYGTDGMTHLGTNPPLLAAILLLIPCYWLLQVRGADTRPAGAQRGGKKHVD
jgi:hypothetical protein